MDPLTLMSIAGTATQGIGSIASIFDTSEEDMFKKQMAMREREFQEGQRQFGITQAFRERESGRTLGQSGIGILSGLRAEAQGMAKKRNFRDALLRAGRMGA